MDAVGYGDKGFKVEFSRDDSTMQRTVTATIPDQAIIQFGNGIVEEIAHLMVKKYIDENYTAVTESIFAESVKAEAVAQLEKWTAKRMEERLPAADKTPDFGEKGLGVNPDTGCISDEGLSHREIVVKCPRCGIGEDTDGDGHCGWCARMTDEMLKDAFKQQKIQFAPYTEPTLRDRFAMAALTGLLASCNGPAWGRESFPLGDTSYAYADQLLEARKK